MRADGGSEFNHIEKFMDGIDGSKRLIRGKSVHNVRIERLWRDTREKVLDKYRYTFIHMEESGVLDVNDLVHMYCLHYVYRPRISADLNQWRDGWNNHGIRTENYKTPLQMFISGMIANVPSSHTFRMDAGEREGYIREFRDENQMEEPGDIGIVLERIAPPITDVEVAELATLVDPLAVSTKGGLDLYGSAINFVKQCMRN